MYKYDDKEKKWDVPGHLISCVDTFNVLLRPHFYSTEFGGQNVKLNLKRFGSNILATSEMKDPFSYNGLLENVTDSILAVTTKNGIHMADMRGLGGPSYIIEQQRKILEIITGLVDQYRADAKELHR
ncbi:hypothetical protein GIB67_004512 [Kingdonia uniflora]|uniref:Uncharacterized protein n=1 Tax=Kingdonia uniflora TaxID=39325 RepID=A0A7J7LSE6_9MAGN|nr:hypothetical protein GIB67_004512 [Kingdonia uniflora]